MALERETSLEEDTGDDHTAPIESNQVVESPFKLYTAPIESNSRCRSAQIHTSTTDKPGDIPNLNELV